MKQAFVAIIVLGLFACSSLNIEAEEEEGKVLRIESADRIGSDMDAVCAEEVAKHLHHGEHYAVLRYRQGRLMRTRAVRIDGIDSVIVGDTVAFSRRSCDAVARLVVRG